MDITENPDLFKPKGLPVVTENKKLSSKEVVPITYTLEKSFVAAATFEGLWVISFHREYKKCNILGSV